MIDEVFTYLAVAENKQFFAQITLHMLSKCTRGLYTVCPSNLMLRTAGEPNCLTALFLGKNDVMLSKCKRLLLNETFEPVWIGSPDATYCIYSLSTPQQVAVQCQGRGSPPTVSSNYQPLLAGTGVLPNSSSCYVHAENFKLLPHSLGKTVITMSKAHIVLPAIDNVLHPSEDSVLQSITGQPADLQRLDDILVRAASRSHVRGIEVTRAVGTLQGTEASQPPLHLRWMLGIALTFLLLGASWPFWLKPIFAHCPYRNRGINGTTGQLGVLTPSLELNQCETGSQVPLDGDNGHQVTVEQGTSSQQDRKDLIIPTEFVRHGQGLDDRR